MSEDTQVVVVAHFKLVYLSPGSGTGFDDSVPKSVLEKWVKGEQPCWVLCLRDTRIHARSHGPEEGIITGHGS